MEDTTQKLYVHDTDEMRDEGEMKTVVQLNTRGETPPKARAVIYDKISETGIELSKLASEIDKDIGIVHFSDDGEVQEVELMDWVKEEYL